VTSQLLLVLYVFCVFSALSNSFFNIRYIIVAMAAKLTVRGQLTPVLQAISLTTLPVMFLSIIKEHIFLPKMPQMVVIYWVC